MTHALSARGVRPHVVAVDDPRPTFSGSVAALRATAESAGPLDAVVVALSSGASSGVASSSWERVLDEHAGIVGHIRTDAAWARAVADHAADTGRPMRLVTLVDASDSGGRSRAQAAAQHSRAAHKGTQEQVAAYTVSLEEGPEATPVGELVAHLLCSPDATALSGAELGGRSRLVRPAPPSPPRGGHQLRRTRAAGLARRHAPPDRRQLPRPTASPTDRHR